jgi:hypothetical protein
VVAITDLLALPPVKGDVNTPFAGRAVRLAKGPGAAGQNQGPKRAEDARILARARPGDGPLSVRVRPSSIKRDCDRRPTSTGGKCLVNVHAKSCLTPESLRTLRSETKGQAAACPDRTQAIPCTVLAVTRQFP